MKNKPLTFPTKPLLLDFKNISKECKKKMTFSISMAGKGGTSIYNEACNLPQIFKKARENQ